MPSKRLRKRAVEETEDDAAQLQQQQQQTTSTATTNVVVESSQQPEAVEIQAPTAKSSSKRGAKSKKNVESSTNDNNNNNNANDNANVDDEPTTTSTATAKTAAVKKKKRDDEAVDDHAIAEDDAQPIDDKLDPRFRDASPSASPSKLAFVADDDERFLAAQAAKSLLEKQQLDNAASQQQQGPTKRLIIKEMLLENFKSYAGEQKIGPFHKVKKYKQDRPLCFNICLFFSTVRFSLFFFSFSRSAFLPSLDRMEVANQTLSMHFYSCLVVDHNSFVQKRCIDVRFFFSLWFSNFFVTSDQNEK